MTDSVWKSISLYLFSDVRVCAKLVEDQDTCEELRYPKDGREVSFWEITGQQRWNWKDKICGGPNPGTNW